MMEVTYLEPYYPVIQHYEPEKISKLFMNENEPHYTHSHLNFDDMPITVINPNIEKIISIYAHIKYDIDNLEKILQDPSIKKNPVLYANLIKILNHDQLFISFVFSSINAYALIILKGVKNNPLSLKLSNEEDCRISPYDSEKERGKEKEGPSQLLSSPVFEPRVKDKHSDSIRFNCTERVYYFKTYQSLCHLISSIKADLAYFNNIENSQEWALFSTQSEELKELFKFKVEIEKNKDEIYLQMLEKIEPEAKQHHINVFIHSTVSYSDVIKHNPTSQAPPNSISQTMHPPLFIPMQGSQAQEIEEMTRVFLFNLKQKKSVQQIFEYTLSTLFNVIPKECYKALSEIRMLDPNSRMTYLKLLSLLERLKNENSLGGTTPYSALLGYPILPRK